MFRHRLYHSQVAPICFRALVISVRDRWAAGENGDLGGTLLEPGALAAVTTYERILYALERWLAPSSSLQFASSGVIGIRDTYTITDIVDY
jgi:hypothetical protein